MQRTHRTLATLASVVTSITVVTAGATQAAASPDIYSPPTPLPAGQNGDIIKHESSEAPANAQRIMYRSTDTHGDPIAITGTVMTPQEEWTGSGPRPIVSYAPGTQGLGDKCAPSKRLAGGFEYEKPFITGLLDKGYGVVVTDYQGLGTPGVHTYVNSAAEAHAALDAAKAAQRLPEAGLPDDGPVALAGYSQGGGASAAAAERAPEYAPGLDIVGAYAGAPPADLDPVARNLDGHYAAAFLGFATLGLNEAYPELDIMSQLNDKGKQLAEDIKTQCTSGAITSHAFTQTSTLTKDGRPLTAYLDEEPYASRVDEQQIGNRTPEAPILVAHSMFDDIVPYDQAKTMASKWCQQGATVQFSTLLVPTHVGGALDASGHMNRWLADRFAGEEAPRNCGGF